MFDAQYEAELKRIDLKYNKAILAADVEYHHKMTVLDIIGGMVFFGLSVIGWYVGVGPGAMVTGAAGVALLAHGGYSYRTAKKLDKERKELK
jgi:hypothetical protein